jgi:hypothetical protein
VAHTNLKYTSVKRNVLIISETAYNLKIQGKEEFFFGEVAHVFGRISVYRVYRNDGRRPILIAREFLPLECTRSVRVHAGYGADTSYFVSPHATVGLAHQLTYLSSGLVHQLTSGLVYQ